MPRFRIHWDYGYGEDSEIIEAETEEVATDTAYARWREGAESQADYGSKEVSEDFVDE